jgi:mono/diheme cytochrome c family protein
MCTRLLLAAILSLEFVRATAADAEAGKRVYVDYCATCHGEDLQNNSSASFDLRRLRESERARFVSAVTNGKKAMPSWKGVLGDDKIEALWSYVRANAYP